MADRLVGVVAANFALRLMARDDDVIGDIRSFLDGDGDETDDIEDARVAIVEWRDGTWSPVELEGFDGAVH